MCAMIEKLRMRDGGVLPGGLGMAGTGCFLLTRGRASRGHPDLTSHSPTPVRVAEPPPVPGMQGCAHDFPR
jgi:hypothetical protein